MSRSRTVSSLASRNTLRSPGRTAVLFLLLTAAIVGRSTAALAVQGLCHKATAAVEGEALLGATNCTIFFPGVSYNAKAIQPYFTRTLGRTYLAQQGFWNALAERYWGPGGLVTVLRPGPLYRDSRASAKVQCPPSALAKGIEGRYPAAPDEVAVPAPLASEAGLKVGSRLELLPVAGGAPATFTVTGIYIPRGSGPFHESALVSAATPEQGDEVNFFVVRLDEGAVGRLLSGRDPASVEVVTYADPVESMELLARAAYGAKAAVAETGVSLAGVVVLVVLLVAFIERRREVTVYKMVGMDGASILRVLATELAVILVTADAVAAPVYRLVATRLVLDGQAAASGTALWSPFLTSVLWTAAVVALGASYPLALTSVATAGQLSSGSRIYLIRRRQLLRGWTDDDLPR